MVNPVWLSSQCWGIGPHLKLIWGTQSSFVLLQWPHGPSRFVTVFLGTLWSSIKEVKAPFVFDMEHGLALQAMQENRASAHCEAEVSWFFLSCGGNLGNVLELRRGWPCKTRVGSARSGLRSRWEGHLSILLEVWQGNRDASRCEAVDPVSLSSCHRELGFLSIFQRDRHRLLLKHWTRRDSRVVKAWWGLLIRRGGKLGLSLGFPQGILTPLHLVRWKMSLHSSQCREICPSFKSGHLGVHSTWGGKIVSFSHSEVERGLLLRYMWKVGIPLESKPGNQLSCRDDLGYMELSSSCCAELGVPLDLGRCSRVISGVA